MSISQSTASSPRSSFLIKPHLEENTQVIQELRAENTKRIKGSYFFTGGKQERDERFERFFKSFFRELRGPEPLVSETAQSMADRFTDRYDISYSRWPCEGFGTPAIHYPSPELVEALESIIERECGFQEQFLSALDQSGRKFSDLKLEDHDSQYRNYYVLCRLFPRCVDTMQEIFKALLTIEWLEEDIHGIKNYIEENDWIDKCFTIDIEEAFRQKQLWQITKKAVEGQKEYDAKLSAKHWSDFKTDIYQTVVSGALSVVTKNPQYFVGQTAKVGMNVVGRKVDPEGKSKGVKALNMLGSMAVSKATGGNNWDLGTSLGVDILELSTREENTSEERSLLKGYGTALLKGALTGDKKKLTSQLLGFIASEVANELPEIKEESSEKYRFTRAALTNPDVHGHLIDKCLKKAFKEEPLPEIKELSQEEKPIEEVKEEWIEDVLNETLYKENIEKEKQAQEQHQRDFAKYEQDLIEYNRKIAHQQAVNQAIDGIKKKEGHLIYRAERLEERLETLQKMAHRKSALEKARKQVIKYNNAISDRDNAMNHYYCLIGSNERVSTPKMKKPQKPSWDDRLASRLTAMGFESINVSVSVPLYPTKTPNITDRHIPINQTSTPPVKPEPIKPQSNPIEQIETKTFTFQDVQSLERQKIFEANMAFKSVSTTQTEMSHYNANIGRYWRQGTSGNIQRSPIDTREAIQSGIRAPVMTMHNPIERGGFGPFAISVKTWVNKHVQETVREIRDNPIKAKKDQFVGVILGAKKAVVIAIQAFEQPSLKQRPNTYGLEELSNRCDRWVAGKFDVDLDSKNTKVGMFVGEFFAPMGMVKTARPVMKVGEEAIHFLRGTRKAQPLLDRVLVRPESFSKQLRAIEALQQPAYRSGFVSEATIRKLADRNVRAIKQIENFVGKESRAFYNQAGDIIIESKDGLRQFRIDLIRTKPHKNPHSHVVVFENFKNFKRQDKNIRVFPKGLKEE